jgi:hypothetical protein
MESKKYDLIFVADVVPIAQMLLFVLGSVLAFISFPGGDSVFMLYYFIVWFVLFAVINLFLIVLVVIKRPKGYIGLLFSLLVCPVVLGLIGILIAYFSTGGPG